MTVKSLVHLLSVTVLLLVMQGCTLMQPRGDELAARLDTLLAEKRYGEALDTLARVPPDSPDYLRFTERRKQIEGIAAQYEHKTIDEARQLVARDRWGEALNLYDEALQRLPRSTSLRDGLANLHRQQQSRLFAIEDELVINKGEWLAAVIPVYRRMVTVDPRDSDHDAQLRKYQSEGEQTAEALYKLGNRAIESGNDEVASRAILLAARLSEKKEIQQLAQKYEQSHDKRARDNRAGQPLPEKRLRELAQREQERAEAIAQLTAEYNNAMKQKDYITARTTLGRLNSFAPEVVRERDYEKELNAKIVEETNRSYNEGVMYYGRSQFEKARDSWKKTLELTPSHSKARESLDRVEKVLERIEQLRNKQKNP
ncbi:MAG TPA: hypothetical protein VGE50_13330 [Gammaproteobacteria bacterium]